MNYRVLRIKCSLCLLFIILFICSDILYFQPIDKAKINLLRRVRSSFQSISQIFQGRNIRLTVFDFDSTLASSHKPVDDELLSLIYRLNKNGVKVLIISGSWWEAIDVRFIQELKKRYQDFNWGDFFIATHIGSVGYKFNKQGERCLLYGHPLTRVQKDHIERTLEEFKNIYGEDKIREFAYREDYKWYLVFNNSDGADEYRAFFQNRFQGYGLKMTHTGQSPELEISVSDKKDAIRYFKKMLTVDKKEVVIIGDSFVKKYSNDRGMIDEGVLVFNVGDSIPQQLKAGVIDLNDYLQDVDLGPKRTAILLRALLSENRIGN